ncbi:MAG: hypothetical protein K8R19_05620 [Methanosarcinales archaeon]|nr:hypothetical protein [Methanosarcinales archaeon]
MEGRSTDRRERFARNWKLLRIPSKSNFQENLLNSRILTSAITRLMDQFQSQTLPVIEDVCYQLGKEDSNNLKSTLHIKKDTARSCLEPIEMVCLLNGIDTDIISEKNTTASLKIYECPFNDVLVGIVPNIVVCRNYFKGMAHAINPNVSVMQPKKKCNKDGQCEFAIKVTF